MTPHHENIAKGCLFSGGIDYERDLNPSQLEAVTAGPGPALVIAGAGSGKTRTIVYRVAWAVEHGADPASVLLLTFTRKSAEEMLSRAAQLLDARVSRVSGGTFHSTGNILLRRYGRAVGFDSGFSIMDQGDSIEAVEHVRSERIPKERLKGFPKARTILEVVSRAKGVGVSIEEALGIRYPHLVDSFADEIESIRAAYEAHKRANNLMDYDDLLLNTVLLLEERQEIRAEVSLRWGQILVDEFQDTNRLQARMLKLLASEHHNVMAVGDDSQSIYSFRGANFQNIMEFPKLFPDARIIKLEENYRSAAPILAVTNAIIAAARVGYPKRLFTRRADGPLPLLVRPESEQGQSRFVVKCIEELTQHGIPSGEIAVLFRAGFHSFDLEAELNRRRIPFVKYGGMKFIESGHIKDVLAHLKILNNPADRLSWIRILKLLPGVGVKTAGDLARRIAAEGVPDIPELLAPKKRKYSVQFHELMQLFKDLKNMGGAISEKVDRVNKYYFPYLQDNFDNYPKRMKDLDQLADMTTRYRSLNQFLNDMALEPPDDGVVGKGRRADSLVLSTIHSSKGLEWHSVILIWATEGRIPSPMAEESPDDLEEERRLLYVAATRAKHNLVIVAPMEQMDRVRGITRVALCRFIQDAPAEYFRTYAASLCD